MEPGSIQHKKESWILFNLAWPVSVGYFLQFGLNLTSIMFVGRLGTSELAASALATMFSNVTGFSIGISI